MRNSHVKFLLLYFVLVPLAFFVSCANPLGNGSYIQSGFLTPTTISELDLSWTPQWSDLVAYWKMNETSGSIVDSVGGRTVAAAGTLTYSQTGQLNQSINFNGSTGYFQSAYDAFQHP